MNIFKHLNLKKTCISLVIFSSLSANAEKFNLPPADVDLVGMVRQVVAPKEKTLYDIGRDYGVGYDAMVNANPNVDIQMPNPDGNDTKVLVPTRYILPNNVPRDGIVINLPEMRLYYFTPDHQSVHVFAVGIGREDWSSPVGVHSITAKTPNPTWTPPASIRAEHAAEGDILPAVVPAGPDNPLGLFAMRLSAPGYLLHGTNKPDGVGMRVSHGCIRMFPEGIEQLFAMATVGTKVNIIKQEMKIGMYGDELYLEYHPPISEDNIDPETAMHRAIEKVHQEAAKHGLSVEEDLIRAVVNEASGMPVSVAYKNNISKPTQQRNLEGSPYEGAPLNPILPEDEQPQDIQLESIQSTENF